MTPKPWGVTADQQAGYVAPTTEAVLGDLDAVTSELAITVNVTTVPLTLKLALGVLTAFMMTFANLPSGDGLWTTGETSGVVHNVYLEHALFVETGPAIGTNRFMVGCGGGGNVKGTSTFNGDFSNAAFGNFALDDYVGTFGTPGRNVAVGNGALHGLSQGVKNTAIGASAQGGNQGGSYNTSVGDSSLDFNNGTTDHGGHHNAAFGYAAGTYWDKDDRLFINTYDQGDQAHDISDSLIYGVFGPDHTTQELHFNVVLLAAPYLPTSSSGLPAGAIWNNSGVLHIV